MFAENKVLVLPPKTPISVVFRCSGTAIVVCVLRVKYIVGFDS